ncbi:MAG: MBL fold metallo-hydrolase [Labilithrix sp.]|nr:MBL fold metallo-hydrolase [Labilithrix sp.]
MIFRQLFDKETSTYTYLVADDATGDAALVDPVLEHVERDLELVRELGCRLVSVFDTHVHADHVTGAGALRERTKATTHVSVEGGAPCADVEMTHGHVARVGGVEITALATPGHTSGCMSFVVAAEGERLRVLTGDALLVRGCGRTDFQEGDAATLWRSVHERLFVLPDDTLVYPAHDYRGFTVSTVGEEKRLNPRLGARMDLESFVTLMKRLDLPPPGKIHEAVPANRACGQRDRAAPSAPEPGLRERS